MCLRLWVEQLGLGGAVVQSHWSGHETEFRRQPFPNRVWDRGYLRFSRAGVVWGGYNANCAATKLAQGTHVTTEQRSPFPRRPRMSEESDFADFLKRIRAGDAEAAEELVRRYEPLIRREMRLTVHDPRLHRHVDDADICQSVLASFFVRAGAGQYDLTQPMQLLHLLMRMTRNKVVMAARRERSQRRDNRRLGAVSVEEVDPAGAAPTPSRVVASRELLGRVRQLLQDEERAVADMRAEGQAWADIAAALGGTADGRRMQLTRALDRVIRQLGLEEEWA
jgi:DNA-directed RNA polymerase specialized sigma24 family protein